MTTEAIAARYQLVAVPGTELVEETRAEEPHCLACGRVGHAIQACGAIRARMQLEHRDAGMDAHAIHACDGYPQLTGCPNKATTTIFGLWHLCDTCGTRFRVRDEYARQISALRLALDDAHQHVGALAKELETAIAWIEERGQPSEAYAPTAAEILPQLRAALLPARAWLGRKA